MIWNIFNIALFCITLKFAIDEWNGKDRTPPQATGTLWLIIGINCLTRLF